MAKKIKKSRKQKAIDELDTLGIDFEEVYESEDGTVVEMSTDELELLLKKEKEKLKNGKHNGKENEPEIKPLPKKKDNDEKKSASLSDGLDSVIVTKEELAELQSSKKLIGYYEKNNKRYAIIKKGD